ncbi:uncharacterized protein LMH87_008321 [Akanthomyces muscarius]|uniref:Uncharacterized protein n=1 Tax=Akanthomyces muscarius TaxID=2231603 RepID=A0A9W8UQS3_AKAMU|nr:uncharacterized protein LMH87_008321 [Akanthomyces muscarius]KAJ4159419.1 hypothetical protein LMH87_008321 [Akanthomyces muscarius]
MASVPELQKKYDEISAIRNAAISDFTLSNARKREIAQAFTAARTELRAASKAAMAARAKPKQTPTADQLPSKPSMSHEKDSASPTPEMLEKGPTSTAPELMENDPAPTTPGLLEKGPASTKSEVLEK